MRSPAINHNAPQAWITTMPSAMHAKLPATVLKDNAFRRLLIIQAAARKPNR